MGGEPDVAKEESRSPTLQHVLGKIRDVDVYRARVTETFFGDMRACFENFYDALAPGGHACIVIGDRTVRQVTVPNAKILTEDAQDIGFEHIKTLSRRIFFKVRPYKLNPIARTGKEMTVPGIGKEEIVILRTPTS